MMNLNKLLFSDMPLKEIWEKYNIVPKWSFCYLLWIFTILSVTDIYAVN